MAIQRIFKSTLPSFRFFSTQGIAAIFINGRFTTDNKKVEEELMAEVGEVGQTKSRHTFIFIDEDEKELDTEALSPLELLKLSLKEEARAELLAEMKAQTARAMDATGNVSSTSADFKSSLNNTATLETAGESNANDAKPTVPVVSAVGSMAARLANLTSPKA